MLLTRPLRICDLAAKRRTSQFFRLSFRPEYLHCKEADSCLGEQRRDAFDVQLCRLREAEDCELGLFCHPFDPSVSANLMLNVGLMDFLRALDATIQRVESS